MFGHVVVSHMCMYSCNHVILNSYNCIYYVITREYMKGINAHTERDMTILLLLPYSNYIHTYIHKPK